MLTDTLTKVKYYLYAIRMAVESCSNELRPKKKETTNFVLEALLSVLLLDWFVHCQAVRSQATFAVPNLSGLIRAQCVLAR